jgi:hypothetical protein
MNIPLNIGEYLVGLSSREVDVISTMRRSVGNRFWPRRHPNTTRSSHPQLRSRPIKSQSRGSTKAKNPIVYACHQDITSRGTVDKMEEYSSGIIRNSHFKATTYEVNPPL